MAENSHRLVVCPIWCLLRSGNLLWNRFSHLVELGIFSGICGMHDWSFRRSHNQPNYPW